MAEPLHLQPDPEPEMRQVHLGDGSVVTLSPEDAQKLENSYQSMAAQYGAQLEEYQRRAMQTFGTQQPMPQAPQYAPQYPDPDLMFQNKDAWSAELGNAIQQQIGAVRGESYDIAQRTVAAVQGELARRDAAMQAKALHDRAMEQMLDQKGLTEHTRIVQAIYNEQFEKYRNLPLEMALDKIGNEAIAEIERIRSGEQWSLVPGAAPQGVTQRPPAMLRSARRAARAPAPPPERSDELMEPGGGLKAMGMIIRKHQARYMGGGS